MSEFTRTDRTTLKRRPSRGEYDKDLVFSILDDGFMCMIAYMHNNTPMVLPTGYGRIGNKIYIHGSNKSTMMNAALSGQEVCVNVTHIDGLVLARCLYNHSVNYRSVVVFGTPKLVEDKAEKLASFRAFSNHVLKGRVDDVRPPNDKELNTTTVMSIEVAEAVAKVRTGPPTDFDKDLELDCWAGQLLFKTVVADTPRNPFGRQDAPLPDYIANYEKNPYTGLGENNNPESLSSEFDDFRDLNAPASTDD